MKDKETKENKGFAFVTFTAKDVAQRAIEELHDKDHKVMCGFSLQDIVGSLAYMIMMHNVEWFLCRGEHCDAPCLRQSTGYSLAMYPRG
jgi:hypothetical protein